jgi:hypothetical protein
MSLPNALIQYISEFTDFVTSHKFARLNKWCAGYLKIKYINSGPWLHIFRKCINDNILCHKRYSHLIKFISPGEKVTQINHLIYLQELYIDYYAAIDDSQLQQLINLRILSMTHYIKITKINHLTSLQKLFIIGDSNIEDEQLSDLINLKVLHITGNNTKIKNISHLINLEELIIGGASAIDDLKNLTNLRKLVIKDNIKIKNIKHCTKLLYLDINGISALNDEQIQPLNLCVLKMNNNMYIKQISHMTNLRNLEANYTFIDNEQLQNLNLEILRITGNEKIKNISHMTNLKILVIGGECDVDTNQLIELFKNKKALNVLSKTHKIHIRARANKKINRFLLAEYSDYFDLYS